MKRRHSLTASHAEWGSVTLPTPILNATFVQWPMSDSSGFLLREQLSKAKFSTSISLTYWFVYKLLSFTIKICLIWRHRSILAWQLSLSVWMLLCSSLAWQCEALWPHSTPVRSSMTGELSPDSAHPATVPKVSAYPTQSRPLLVT